MSAKEHDEQVTPTYWRSLSELTNEAAHQQDPELRGKEFPTEPSRVIDPLHRRNFFQLMGASMALAGVGACRYEKEEIVPLARRPEGQTPGQTQQYATAFELGGVGHALVATSYEGRPIKLDGNPEHPFASGGAVPGTTRHAGSSTFAQAAILHLYDPDRSQSPLSSGKGSSMDAFRAALPELRNNLGTTRVLSEASSSPTLGDLRTKLAEKGVVWHEYEAISFDNEREGLRRYYQRPLRPIAKLDQCDTIVTLDADIFIEHPAALKYSRDYARSRKLHGSLGIGKMNRMWTVESQFSNTGAMADHRLALRSELILPLVLALDSLLGGGSAKPTSQFLDEKKVSQFVKVLASELQLAKDGKTKAVVIVGHKQPPEVHWAVAKLNQTINALGRTLDYHEVPDPTRVPHLQSIVDLVKEINAGRVDQLIILGGNPVYDAPADLDFAGALAKVKKTSVHLSDYQNETSLKTTWHVPRSHFLEAWGDTRTWDGTVTIAQPLISPLYSTLSAIELLSMLEGSNKSGQQLVQDAHASRGFTNWRQSVHDGFVSGPGAVIADASTLAVDTSAAPPAPNQSQLGGSKRNQGDIEVTYALSPFAYDGRFANNAWLQETPDFMTKVVWDNYCLIAPDTAEQLSIKNYDMVTVKVGDKSMTLPAYTIPGQARSSIALVLGGGRTAAGRVGGKGDKHRVGWDTNKVRLSTGFDIAQKASITSTGDHYELATTQEHWDIRIDLRNGVTQGGIAERVPELIRAATKETLEEHEKAKNPWRAEEPQGYHVDLATRSQTDRPDIGGWSLFKEKEYLGHRWGMAIDLSTCTGCNACMVACQAENNVPVVGRQEVINNREMHWIRIDRYFAGSPDDPQVVHQPVACQHCEQAPCEQVCPVGATTHSDEGLNDMAYNRCIGTRYCANNCPYKVRRFNFLDWNKEWRDARNKVRRLLFNPEVTVRMRGVMEKCTFCVQRIQNAKINAKAQVRSGDRAGTVNGALPDGEITTACQDACPTEAIMFGDLADKTSRVSKLQDDNRAYDLLPETYTKPRTRFLARIRNPHPDMPGAKQTSAGHGVPAHDAPAPQGGH
ncbi:MAG: TAT-variant-translocated molybdopterin oxidoreductase [Kofleriaceae bacterium]